METPKKLRPTLDEGGITINLVRDLNVAKRRLKEISRKAYGLAEEYRKLAIDFRFLKSEFFRYERKLLDEAQKEKERKTKNV